MKDIRATTGFVLALFATLPAAAFVDNVNAAPLEIGRQNSGKPAAPSAPLSPSLQSIQPLNRSFLPSAPSAAPAPALAPSAPIPIPLYDGGGSGAPTPASVFIAVNCAYSGDGSGQCQQDVASATESLTDTIAAQAASRLSRNYLTLNFPKVLDRAEQLRLLYTIEARAIAIMELRLANQLRSVAPFPPAGLSRAQADYEITQHTALLNRINAEARGQAGRGENWHHDWSTSRHTFESSAYRQASQINLSGWGRN